MSIELKQAAQDAAEAIDWLLKNIRLDAPQLSGKAMGNAEKCASALRTAIQQAEAQQPATPEPVLVQHRKPVIGWKGKTIGYTPWRYGKGLDGWPHRELYDRPAPSVLKDDQIAALVNKVRDIAHMFHDHQSLRERIANELVPVLKAKKETP